MSRRSSKSDLDLVSILCCTRNGISRYPKTDLTSAARPDCGPKIKREDSVINFGSLTSDYFASQYMTLPLFEYRAATSSLLPILA